MPSQSTLNTDEKNKVKAAIPASSNKILFATLARIYYAHPQPDEWAYAGLQGALAFVKDSSKNCWAFRLVDLNGTRGVIWEYELYNGLEYYPDRAFFHSFAADVGHPSTFISCSSSLTRTGLHGWFRVC
jgi:Wiskott-Aldrich syndrome protein